MGKHHVVSIGGGITSTWLLVDRVIAKYGRENMTAVICAVGNEHPDVWRLIEAVERKYGIQIVRLGKPYDIWDVFFNEGMMGSSLVDPCSRVLKRERMAEYMAANHPPENTVLHVGITADEIDRMLAIRSNWKKRGYTVEALLADEPALTRERVIEMCQFEFGFVPTLYRLGMKHNNCGGFCVKAGKGQLARLLWHDRATYLEHERMELLHQRIFEHQSTIMRDVQTVNGVRTTTPLTLRDFRLRMDARWKGMLPGIDPFESLDDAGACKFCDAAA